MPLSPGEKLGPYTLIDRLGSGGMGEVWKARDTRLGREVAIKTSKDQFTERFEREGRAVAALNHSNIAQLFDIGALPNGAGYMVMEYVEGAEPKGPLPVDEVLKLMAQIADALDAAHEKGITHRDLKPANIKIKPDGTVKVLDFGLAKLGQSATPGSGNPETSPTLTMHATEAGMILGTAGYMSPEQARGKHVDRRADIWAFGVVLYELLTGKKLFTGEDVVDILAAIVMSEPDISAAPAQFQKLLTACLQKDPKQRLQAAGDWRLLLSDDRDAAQPISSPAPSQSRLRKLPWMAAGMLVLALALGVVAYRHLTEEPPRVVKMSVLPPDKVTILGNSLPAVSPDGRHLAFVATMEGKTELWVRDLDSLAARALTGTEGALDPFWSPDNRFIAFYAGSKLKKIDVAGGPALALCDIPADRPRGGSWGKNDVLVFAPNNGNSGIFRVPASGGMATPVTELDKASGDATHRFPWFLPDGRHFLYTVRSAGSTVIYAGDVDAKAGAKSRQRVLAADSMAVYTSPGYLLFVRDQTLMAQSFDTAKLQTTGDAVPMVERIDSGGNAARYQFSVSQNGVLAYSAGGASGTYQLTWTDRSGKTAGTVGSPSTYADLRLSPDEKAIAFDRVDAGNQDIWVMDLARGVTSRLTFDPASENLPMWSPDGSHIEYSINRSGGFDLYSKAATGAGREEVLVKVGTPNAWGTSWSRDGRFLMYAMRPAGAKGGYDLWVAPQFGDRKPFSYLQTQFNEYDGAYSPDGHWVAYASDETGRYEIYVQAFPLSGTKFQISTGGGTEPQWRKDGAELFYWSADGNLMAVPVKSGAAFETGLPRPLFRFGPAGGGSGFHNYAVSNDGQRFLVAANAGERSGPMTVVLNWQAGLKK